MTQATSKQSNWTTKELVSMALLAAIGTILSFIEFPIIPGVPFLKYDASFVPALVMGFAFGPVFACVVGITTAAVHGILSGNWVGALMNMLAVCAYVIPASLLYKANKNKMCAVLALGLAILCACAASVVANLTVGVWFWYGSMDAILPLLLPVIVPFNLIKGVLNSLITLAVYKSISGLINKPRN